MIERLELIDFESHKNTVVDFSQGLNIITGNSDAGKSSLLRALRLVLTMSRAVRISSISMPMYAP